ncbi:MAG: CpsB/CapC family capsule biosynthesis tyrosine phosphatase [Solirubrobacteraceae bacterium]
MHFHLLPGVDDGPSDMEEALELARLAVQDGTGTVLATPHVRDVDVDTVPDRVHEVRASLRGAGIDLTVLGGGEVAWDDVPSLTERQLELIAQGPPGRRWVLLETPLFGDESEEFRAAADELARRGYAVLVGHPERTDGLWEAGDARLGAALQDGPAPLQINASSLLGSHGGAARRRALTVAASGRSALLASDAHRPTRGPSLSLAVAALIEADVPAGVAEDMAAAAPQRLLDEGLAC